jgi:uncharacterized membrane protein
MRHLFLSNLKWMAWNLFLAIIPMIMSLFFFRKKMWYKLNPIKLLFFIFVFSIFYFFLPNSPYVLTDIIHLIHEIKYYPYLTYNQIIVILIPQFMIFFFLGFSFYVIAFQKFLHFLAENNWHIVFIWIIKLINPFIMSIGIFLGRFYNFNSWEIFSDYENIIRFTMKGFSNIYFVFFIIITSLIIFSAFEILSIYYKSIFKKLFNLSKNDIINKDNIPEIS